MCLFIITLFFWADFSSGVFQYLSNGSLAFRIFSASKKGHLGGKDPLATTKTSTELACVAVLL
jgi:hypothetical protein